MNLIPAKTVIEAIALLDRLPGPLDNPTVHTPEREAEYLIYEMLFAPGEQSVKLARRDRWGTDSRPAYLTDFAACWALLDLVPNWRLSGVWESLDILKKRVWSARLESRNAYGYHTFDDRPGAIAKRHEVEGMFQPTPNRALIIAVLLATEFNRTTGTEDDQQQTRIGDGSDGGDGAVDGGLPRTLSGEAQSSAAGDETNQQPKGAAAGEGVAPGSVQEQGTTEVNDQNTVADRVRKIVIDHLDADPDKVTEKASFIDDLGADSLDNIELIMAFEEEFDIEIPDDLAEHAITVGDATRLITEKLST